MKLAREIKKDIYWIGVNDRRTHIFENYWPLPKGVAYNSYIIVDEKVVVIDTIERSKMDDYVENIEQLLNGRKVDYLVINHMEPDHTGAIKALLCHYPMPSSASSRMTSSTSPTISGSSADVASSNSMTFGRMAKERAMATRCF